MGATSELDKGMFVPGHRGTHRLAFMLLRAVGFYEV